MSKKNETIILDSTKVKAIKKILPDKHKISDQYRNVHIYLDYIKNNWLILVTDNYSMLAISKNLDVEIDQDCERYCISYQDFKFFVENYPKTLLIDCYTEDDGKKHIILVESGSNNQEKIDSFPSGKETYLFRVYRDILSDLKKDTNLSKKKNNLFIFRVNRLKKFFSIPKILGLKEINVFFSDRNGGKVIYTKDNNIFYILMGCPHKPERYVSIKKSEV